MFVMPRACPECGAAGRRFHASSRDAEPLSRFNRTDHAARLLRDFVERPWALVYNHWAAGGPETS